MSNVHLLLTPVAAQMLWVRYGYLSMQLAQPQVIGHRDYGNAAQSIGQLIKGVLPLYVPTHRGTTA